MVHKDLVQEVCVKVGFGLVSGPTSFSKAPDWLDCPFGPLDCHFGPPDWLDCPFGPLDCHSGPPDWLDCHFGLGFCKDLFFSKNNFSSFLRSLEILSKNGVDA